MDQIIFFLLFVKLYYTHSQKLTEQPTNPTRREGRHIFLNAAGAPQLYNIDDADGILKIILKLSTKDQQN